MPKKIENEEKKLKSEKSIVKKGKATENKKITQKSKTSSSKVAKSEKNVNQKVTKKLTRKEVETNKKNVAKKTPKTTKKTSNFKSVKNSEALTVKQPEFLQEYYDLPYRYNETIVTILAQTPKKLFVYWDISDKDREAYKKAFGEDFFEKTYPVLLVHNEELNYTFEVQINDFANSWYLDVQDSKSNYVVKLGRKFKNVEQAKNANFDIVKQENINLQNDFIYITDSNKLEIPNDHILFELLSNNVKYRNVKDGTEYTKDLRNLLGDLNKVYPMEAVHELYTKLYENEIEKEDFGRKNPASGELGLPTSSGAFI